MSKATFANIRQTNKQKKLHILVEVKKESRDTVLRSVFTKEDETKAGKDFVVYQLPKSQMKYLTEFNDRRTQTVGDLSVYV